MISTHRHARRLHIARSMRLAEQFDTDEHDLTIEGAPFNPCLHREWLAECPRQRRHIPEGPHAISTRFWCKSS